MKAAQTLLVLAVLFCARGFAVDFYDESGEDLRLRLGDRSQEIRTTSINWYDMVPSVPHPRASETVEPESEPAPLERKLRIVIDAGHGGRDMGAAGYSIFEKNLCLRISRLVKGQLERSGKIHDLSLEVLLSRSTDDFVALGERVRIANDWNADIFVSIHGNASEFPRARGFEVYFLNAEASDADARSLARFENGAQGSTPLKSDVLSILSDVQVTQHVSESSRLAETIFSSLSRHVHANGRGVRQAPFKVLHGTTMPAVLVEVGYLTNYGESQKLSKPLYLKRLASAISGGIIEFATSMKKVI
jgi:N-acetylmuramoyl-L-alanine amidase